MAKILPLDGKYYGTKIELQDGSIIEVWVGADWDAGTKEYVASSREVADGWTPEVGFDHVETARDFRIAQAICNTLTEMGE